MLLYFDMQVKRKKNNIHHFSMEKKSVTENSEIHVLSFSFNSACRKSCVLAARVWVFVPNSPHGTRGYHSPVPCPQSAMGPQDILSICLMSVGLVPVSIVIKHQNVSTIQSSKCQNCLIENKHRKILHKRKHK